VYELLFLATWLSSLAAVDAGVIVDETQNRNDIVLSLLKSALD
jgi:hypothetical protein